MASKGAGKYDEDLDEIDFNNYRGIYFDEEPGKKYQDPDSGAHFDFRDMCKRLYPYSQKQKTREEAESRGNLDRPSPLSQHMLQQTNEIQRIFNERKRKGRSKGPQSPQHRLTFGKENIHAPLNESLYSTSQPRFGSITNQEDVSLSTRSGAIGQAEIQRIHKGIAFSSSGSRNVGPSGPVVTKVKVGASEGSHKRPAQFLSMQGASRKHGGSRNVLNQQSQSLSMDQQQQQSLKQTRLLSYQQGLPVNDLPLNQRHKTPEVLGKKGPRAMMDGQSASKLGDNSLERKTYDGGVNFSHGSTELKKTPTMENYASSTSHRKSQIGRTGSGNVGEISKNFASFYANRRKPMGSNYLQQELNNWRSSTGKYSIGNGFMSQTKVVAKKPSKGYLKKTGSGMTSLNLHLYGSTGKSRNSHTKHTNSLQNYSASHQQHVLSMDNRISNSTLKLSEPKSPERTRKLIIPTHQLSTSTGQYNLQGGHSRNLGLSINQHSSGLSGGGSIGAVNLTAGGGASGRKKIGSYAYQSKKSVTAQQRRSDTKVKSNYRFQIQ